VAHELLTHQKPTLIKNPALLIIDEGSIDALLGTDGQYALALDALLMKSRRKNSGSLMSAREALHRILSGLVPDEPGTSVPVPRRDLARVFASDRCAALNKREYLEQIAVDISPLWTGEKLLENLAVAASNVLVSRRAILWRLIGGAIAPAGPALSGHVSVKRDKEGVRQAVMKGLLSLGRGWQLNAADRGEEDRAEESQDTEHRDIPVFALDATGSLDIMRALWPQAVQVGNSEPLPMPHARMTQVVNKAFSKMVCGPARPSAMPNEQGDDARRARGARDLYAVALREGIERRLKIPGQARGTHYA